MALILLRADFDWCAGAALLGESEGKISRKRPDDAGARVVWVLEACEK